MTDKSAYGVVIGFGGAGLCVLIVALAQLFGQFRHVGPSAMQWVNAHGDAVREVLLRWVA
jgi:hypothetical protein